MVHLNACSFGPNFDKFQALFNSCNLAPDVLILSETWFTHDKPRELTCYIAHHVTRPNGCGGGNSVFINDSIKSFLNPDLSHVILVFN